MRLLATLLLLAPSLYAQTVSLPGPGPIHVSGGGGSSNIVLVQNVACTSGTTNAPYACAITSTGSGHLIVILQNDADNPAAPSAPTDGGDTFTQDFTSAQVAGEGRSTVFHLCNSTSGKTSITINQTSGHSAANIREYSGTATTSCLDTVIGSLFVNSSLSSLTSNPLTASQNDVAIEWCSTGQTATASMAIADNWVDGKDYPQTNDFEDSFSADILNAAPSQVTGTITGATHNYSCGAVLYKSAVAGSSSGNQPLVLMAADGSTNGTTITNALLFGSLHGAPVNAVTTVDPDTGFTFSTTQIINPVTPVFVNGKQYSTLAFSYAYDLGSNGANAHTVITSPLAAPSTSMSWGCMINFPEVSDATNPFTVMGVVGSGTDRAEFFVQNDNWGIETAGGDSSTQSLTGHLNTFNWVTGLYAPGGTHKMRVYTCSVGCGSRSNWTQLGSEATHAATGSDPAISFGFGRFGAETGGTGFTEYASGCQVYSNSTSYPVLP